jgi:hypothetical protein
MYKKKRKKFIEDFNNILPNYINDLPIDISNNKKQLDTNSWFNIDEYNVSKVYNNYNYKSKFPKEIMNCIKVKMLLNNEQKLIINKWMDSYTDIYNKALLYIKSNNLLFVNDINKNKLKNVSLNDYNFQRLRNNLKSEKKNIINNS